MSRIGKMPINLPKGVTFTVSPENVVTVKGPLGELHQEVDPAIKLNIDGDVVSVVRPNDEKEMRSKHGLYRSLLANMVHGVSQGFEAQQEFVGVGYRAAINGQLLEMSLGYSHNVVLELPKEISAEAKSERGKNPTITLKSADKQLLGMVTSKIRSLRKPEPYKGKGIKFVGEQLRRKAGKAAGK